VQIGKIAAAPSGNEDLLSNAVRMLQHGDTPSAFGGFDGAHQPRRASAENYNVKSMDHGAARNSSKSRLNVTCIAAAGCDRIGL